MSRKALPGQMPLSFLAELDKQLAAEQEREREYWARVHAESHIKWCLQQYPPKPEEWDIMTMGIRLCRFVNDHLECHRCNLGPHDHTVGWLFPTKICLKDYYRKCKEWGIKPVIPPQDRWDKKLVKEEIGHGQEGEM